MWKDKTLFALIKFRFFKYIVPFLYVTTFFLSIIIFNRSPSKVSTKPGSYKDKVLYEDPYSHRKKETTSYIAFPYPADVSVLPNAPYKHLQDTTDIRSTYTVYLETVVKYLTKLKENASNTPPPPSLDFHWVDWVEMNVLNPIIKDKPNCFRIGALGSTVRTFWPGCIEDTIIQTGEEEDDKLGFKFTSPANQHESEFRLSLRAKSYLYTTSPVPNRIVFLGGELAFVVKITNKNRLSKNGMLTDFVERKSQLLKVESQELIKLPISPSNELDLISKTLNRPLLNKEGEKFAFVEIKEDNFFPPINDQKTKLAKTARENEQKYFFNVLRTYPENPDDYEELHYDWRFFNKKLNRFQHRAALHHAIRAWLQMTSNLGLTAWSSQESLIGWSRNGLILPWEDVIHFEMPAQDIVKLATTFNNSLIVSDPTDGTGSFLLDVSPNYLERARYNDGGASPDAADARFIDTRTGVFIEITGVVKSDTTIPNQVADSYRDQVDSDGKPTGTFFNSGMGNFYYIDELLPLKKTIFEGRIANVPHLATGIAIREYPDVATSSHFFNYAYQEHLRLWVPDNKCRYVPNEDIDIFSAGGSTYIGACHDDDIWTEYNLTTKATMFKRHENASVTGLSIGVVDQLGSLYPDFWLQDRIKNFRRKFGYK